MGLKMSETQIKDRLLRLPSVEAQTGQSKTEIYRRIKNGTFPKPVKLGVRSVAWSENAIQSYIQSLVNGAPK